MLNKTSSFTDDNDEELDTDPDLCPRSPGDFDIDCAVLLSCEDVA